MFKLDQRLEQDTVWLADLPLCRVLLMNDSRYPWLVLVPRVAGTDEVFELDASQQHQLWDESRLVARIMRRVFSANKMNIATLGNVVRQFHMHVVARFEDDESWPEPVWGRGESRPYSETELAEAREKVMEVLQKTGLEFQPA